MTIIRDLALFLVPHYGFYQKRTVNSLNIHKVKANSLIKFEFLYTLSAASSFITCTWVIYERNQKTNSIDILYFYWKPIAFC